MKDKNFTPLKLFLKKNRMYYNLTELHEANINVSEKDRFYIYNYGNAVLVPRDDEIIRLCRGLVLDETGKVFNYPFRRFFNFHEAECDKVDIENADILEKLDGSLISVWHTGSEWEVTTRGSFYPNENAHNFKETFKRLFNNFDNLTPGFTYMFEMISRDNRIVTKYNDEFVALIGCRNLKNLIELSQDTLDTVAENVGAKVPKRFSATNVQECRQLFENMNDDEEGLVIIDKNMNRFKLKQESYLKMAKIISMKDQDVLDFILGRAELDADFTEMPELQEKIIEVKKVYNEVKEYSKMIYSKIESIESQKEFASHALNHECRGILFALRKGMEFDNIDIKWKNLKEHHSSMVIPTSNKLIVLAGVPGCGKSTWVKELGLEHYVLCPDTLRLMFDSPNPYISQEKNAMIWGITYSMLVSRMSNGDFVIMDAVHATKKSLKEYKKYCETYGYDMKVIPFNISLEEALERNSLRETYKQVPEEVITRMHNQFIETFKKEEIK